VFLKQVVLHGFKSFADRTKFEFGPGLTGVVGPNGCGKSNILDAARWVLGEQSARSLRGLKMADVIFAGSRTRKPANFAEVELLFDNRSGVLPCDDQEVTVGRVLYRSGESEYRLQGNSCRLKDVREILLDTGVGVDAYSMIEQGRVDSFLQASALERREIFEEAAGISRYKVRRTEAQRKLERTQNNLLRLNDVVEELERRLRSVKLAAGKARRYQQHDARLRELRSAFSLAKYHELEQARRAAQAQSDALSDVLQAKRVDLAGRETDAAEYEHALQALDEQIQTGEGDLLSLQTELSALGERITQQERRLTELDETRARQLAHAAESAQRVAALETRLAQEDAARGELAEAEARQAEQIQALQAERTAAEQRCEDARQALEAEKAAAFEAVHRSTLLHNERHNLEQRRSRLAAQADGLNERQDRLQARQAQLAERQRDLQQDAATLDRESSELSAELRGVETRLTELEDERARLDRSLADTKEARSAVASRLGLLEDLDRRQEGVSAGTRWVWVWREQTERSGSVIGLVADVLHIDDPRVGHLQAVLSRFENHVVVRDTYAFFAELGRRGEPPGPIEILALDRLSQRPLTASYEDAPGFVARAADWVRCADEFRPLAEHLLGHIIIVDVMERALALADGAPEGYVFVTLDGHAVATGGRITIGAAKGVSGLISRKAEIRQLRAELDAVETRLERTTRQRSAVEQAASDARLQRDAVLEKIAAAQKRYAETRTELVRLNDEAERLQREHVAIEGESADVRRGLDEIDRQCRQLQAEHRSADTAQQTHHTQVGTLEGRLAEWEAAVARLAQELTDALVEVGRTAERRAACEETLTELRGRLDALAEEKAQAEREAEQAARRIQTAQAELRDARARQETLAAKCEQSQAEVLRLREARQGVRRRLETSGATARRLQGEIDQVEAALHEYEIELRELDVRKEALVARVRDELALELAELYPSYEHGDQDWEAIKAEIEELREKIARLGNVNLDAIAELEELTPRCDNLIAQREDLLSSIRRLETLIAELDAESRTRFAACFEQVRVYFQEVFRKLFGGGKADIILEDPERLLECGIEIIARPPGKEPQSISLLSGGEKALTAVAVLLAVFRTKPSPFAILDEVDAALDESNIDRFNNVLNEFLTESQFVVITHSKRTMQRADALYGVTMEEPGVSKRVGVRFEECVEAPFVA